MNLDSVWIIVDLVLFATIFIVYDVMRVKLRDSEERERGLRWALWVYQSKYGSISRDD